jgi:hypothetical protein
MRKMLLLFLVAFIVLGLSAAWPQDSSVKGKATVAQQTAKEYRSSGKIIRINPEKSTITVRETRSKIERTVIYDAATKLTKGKGTANINEFKDGASVICLGHLNATGELVATRMDLQVK